MNFDRIAPVYRAMEFLTAGGKLQRCRLAFLDEIPPPRRILMAGEGHVRFLPECAHRFPDAHITVVDSSLAMIQIASNSPRSDRVDFVHADILEWQPDAGRFDLVVTQFFLDCFTERDLQTVVAKLASAASMRATWLLADFDHAPQGPARWRTRLIVAMLYRFFRTVTGLRAHELIPPDAHLKNAGFRRNARHTYEWGLLKSEWWLR